MDSALCTSCIAELPLPLTSQPPVPVPALLLTKPFSGMVDENHIRLQSTSVAQHRDIARMESSLVDLRDAIPTCTTTSTTTTTTTPPDFAPDSGTLRRSQGEKEDRESQRQRLLSSRSDLSADDDGGGGHVHLTAETASSDSRRSAEQRDISREVVEERKGGQRGRGWSETSSGMSAVGNDTEQQQRGPMAVNGSLRRGDGGRAGTCSDGVGGRRDVRTEWQVRFYCVFGISSALYFVFFFLSCLRF